jgi:hypothetical protein
MIQFPERRIKERALKKVATLTNRKGRVSKAGQIAVDLQLISKSVVTRLACIFRDLWLLLLLP